VLFCLVPVSGVRWLSGVGRAVPLPFVGVGHGGVWLWALFLWVGRVLCWWWCCWSMEQTTDDADGRKVCRAEGDRGQVTVSLMPSARHAKAAAVFPHSLERLTTLGVARSTTFYERRTLLFPASSVA
jgi:hypothetical protein